MKILFVSGTYTPAKCGVGDYTSLLCRQLASEEGLEIEVITTKGLGRDIVEFPVFDIVEEWTFKEHKKIMKLIKERKPEIVHLQYPTANYGKRVYINFLPLFLRIKGQKVISTIHEYSDNSLLGKIRIWPTILFSNKVIVVDPIYAKDMKKNILFKNKEIIFINIGSNIPKSQIGEEERKAIRGTILDEKHDRIMTYFGLIHKKKCLHTILKAMKELKECGELHCKFLVLGELNKEDPYHSYLLDLIESYNLNNEVKVTGYLRDKMVADYLNASDFAVLPFEGGLSPKNGSFLAAAQEGLPVVSTKPREAFLNSPYVFFLNDGEDTEQLKDYIRMLQNAEGREVQSEIRNIGTTWNNIARKHKELYLK